MTDVNAGGAIYVGTTHYVRLPNNMPGPEIGWSNFGKQLDGVPFPPVMWFRTDMLNHMTKQLFSVRNRYQLDPVYPGWTYDKTYVVRFDCVGKITGEKKFWLWHLTDERKTDGDSYGHTREKGIWRD